MFPFSAFANKHIWAVLSPFNRTGVATYDLGKTMNGCLTGLVGITAACATVDTYAAVIIGIISGWVYLLASHLLIKLKIDGTCIPLVRCALTELIVSSHYWLS